MSRIVLKNRGGSFYDKDKRTVLDAKFEAQKIAFAPFVFQATLSLRDLGILEAIEKSGEKGIDLDGLTRLLNVPRYGIKVLTEAGLGIGLLFQRERNFVLTNTGYFILHDEMTRVNMNFVQDVNYRGFFHLKEAIESGKPAGLKELGDWQTLYPGLSQLPPAVQKSWFDFDHFYSDAAFNQALPLVFSRKPKRMMDIGGNTGKWALQCLRRDPDVRITIVDLPGQLKMAEENIQAAGFQDRVDYFSCDLLQPENRLPEGHDGIWMSQFLDCFSTEQIVSILKRAAEVMDKESRLFILETFWDRQKYEAAAFCLQQTSLYFACMANGNSQMYHSDDMKACLQAAGFSVEQETDHIGISHTLLMCNKADK